VTSDFDKAGSHFLGLVEKRFREIQLSGVNILWLADPSVALE
jgi:hypothetical protein